MGLTVITASEKPQFMIMAFSARLAQVPPE